MTHFVLHFEEFLVDVLRYTSNFSELNVFKVKPINASQDIGY